MSSPLLVIGAAGQVGHELTRELMPRGGVVPVTRRECDLGDLNALRSLVRSVMPGVIVNAAAYTAVDTAEVEREQAFLLNESVPALLAEEARAVGALLVHYSTDYVFEGTRSTPYVESDDPSPLNVYGASKWAGEERIRASGADHLIFRTSWVYGTRGKNFLRSIAAAARTRAELRVVADQVGTPTWSRFLASATALVIERLGHLEPAARERALGTYHLSATGTTSWHAFAEASDHPAYASERDAGLRARGPDHDGGVRCSCQTAAHVGVVQREGAGGVRHPRARLGGAARAGDGAVTAATAPTGLRSRATLLNVFALLGSGAISTLCLVLLTSQRVRVINAEDSTFVRSRCSCSGRCWR